MERITKKTFDKIEEDFYKVYAKRSDMASLSSTLDRYYFDDIFVEMDCDYIILYAKSKFVFSRLEYDDEYGAYRTDFDTTVDPDFYLRMSDLKEDNNDS